MTTETMIDNEPEAGIAASAERAEAPKAPGKMRSLAGGAWRIFVGTIFGYSPLLAVAVVGWTYRLMQRAALKAWFRRAEVEGLGSFHDFLAENESTREHVRLPNWVVAPDFIANVRRGPDAGKSKLKFYAGLPIASLKQNLKLGIQGLFNTWVVTIPACSLWLFSWYAGWNNSFHKDYEQAWVGPVTGLSGVALFIAAMFYVPMAQARQAVTGDWKTFYDYRLIRRLAKKEWPACVVLAGCYAALSFPLMVMRIIPGFFDAMNPNFASLSEAEILQTAKNYYFWVCLVGFIAYIALRIIASRIYARAVVGGIRDGVVQEEELAPFERENLRRAGLLYRFERGERHAIIRAIGWSGTRMGRIAGGVAAALLWFAFVAQIYVLEFFYYHPFLGFMNQPLVQLPWFYYVPNGLG